MQSHDPKSEKRVWTHLRAPRSLPAPLRTLPPMNHTGLLGPEVPASCGAVSNGGMGTKCNPTTAVPMAAFTPSPRRTPRLAQSFQVARMQLPGPGTKDGEPTPPATGEVLTCPKSLCSPLSSPLQGFCPSRAWDGSQERRRGPGKHLQQPQNTTSSPSPGCLSTGRMPLGHTATAALGARGCCCGDPLTPGVPHSRASANAPAPPGHGGL